MCRASEYPPFDGEAVGALQRAAEVEDDEHEAHLELSPDLRPTHACERCQSDAERAWERRWM